MAAPAAMHCTTHPPCVNITRPCVVGAAAPLSRNMVSGRNCLPAAHVCRETGHKQGRLNVIACPPTSSAAAERGRKRGLARRSRRSGLHVSLMRLWDRGMPPRAVGPPYAWWDCRPAYASSGC
eukprot:365154-Chlamydomonas_euryale.AAC.17